MVTTIVIPQDTTGEPHVQELAGLDDFQKVTGGFLEPFEVAPLGITFWVNEAAARERGGLNARATALYWYYNAGHGLPNFMLGDVVVSGNGSRRSGGDVPEELVFGLVSPHCFVVQVSPDDDDHWQNTFARFDYIYDATLWCMLLARSFEHGPAFRVQAEAPSGTEALLEED